MLRSQTPFVDEEDEEMSIKKVCYVYDAAEERAKELAAEEAAELASLALAKPRRSQDQPPTRTNSKQSSI